MSLFLRWLRSAPPPPRTVSPADRQGPVQQPDRAAQKPGAADRALLAAAEEGALQRAIEAGDSAAVARWVVTGASTKVRQAAAQAIDEPELLRQLIRDVRGGNDKSVYRILTAKRDALLDAARQHEQRQAELDAASVALEHHSRQPHDAAFASRLRELETRWEAVEPWAEAERRDRVQQSVARAQQTLTDHARAAASRALQEQAAAAAAGEARQQREQEAQVLASAAAEEAQALEEQQRAQADAQERRQQALRQIGELLRKARGALNEGGTARAAAMRRTLEQALASAPPLPASLATQLQALDQQLAELKDWKSFSVAPKRADLIAEMELLIGVALEPLALDERIKSLQAEWRTLAKGAGEQVEADQQRFQDAAQKAHRPCHEYFAAQALVREENLRRRDALLARLTAFEAAQGEPPDWRALANTVRDAKQEWRRHLPVDWVRGKPQQARFVALVAGLQGRLDAEHARNLLQKETLVDRSRQLLASEDARQTIEAVKALQQQWQSAGPVPREADQRLWTAFRQHCDAVFQKRDQAAAAHATALEDNKAGAIALCEQIERIVAAGSEAVPAGALDEWRAAFEALGELPRAETRPLRQRFDRALARGQEAVARQQRRDAERAWDDLFDAADRIRAYWLAVTQGMDAERLEAAKAAAEHRIAQETRWPRDGLAALRAALAAMPAMTLAENETAARLLCIRAEMRADLPTPPEDQARRREYQLQRLVQGMGQRDRADDPSLDALAIEWVRLGPVEAATFGALQARFRRARAQGGVRAESRR